MQSWKDSQRYMKETPGVFLCRKQQSRRLCLHCLRLTKAVRVFARMEPGSGFTLRRRHENVSFKRAVVDLRGLQFRRVILHGLTSREVLRHFAMGTYRSGHHRCHYYYGSGHQASPSQESTKFVQGPFLPSSIPILHQFTNGGPHTVENSRII